MNEPSRDSEGHHAWDPGIRSAVPHEYLQLVSMFRSENSFIDIDQIHELSSFTGLDREELAAFRATRLALHSLLIRITANVQISDGNHYQDLGINFRKIAATLERSYLRSLLPEINKTYDDIRGEVESFIAARLEQVISGSKPPQTDQKAQPRGLFKLFSRRTSTPAKPKYSQAQQRDRETQSIDAIECEAAQASNELHERSLRSLARLLRAVSIKHGGVRGDTALLTSIATNMTMNIVASARIGALVEQGFAEAVEKAGYTLLPHQEKPVVMNVKGASAAGKSTLRPLQQKLAARLGYSWEEFALISPDIWRKYLLDYQNLGNAWRYAGSLSGQELKFVDRKLDLYMAMKGRLGQIPHLLIDRFRFDSFAEVDEQKGEGRLLTRFGHKIFMTFVITPPEETVQRAWLRGLKVQRYKPVEDLLDHNVEAYTGMPPLFFRWATREDKHVHYEILDNGVAEEKRPPTIAFGEGGELIIFRMRGIINVDYFKKINIKARGPEEVYLNNNSSLPENNLGFFLQCVSRLKKLSLADAETAIVYAKIEGGMLTVLDEPLFDNALKDIWTHAAIAAIDEAACKGTYTIGAKSERIDEENPWTVGQWGSISKNR